MTWGEKLAPIEEYLPLISDGGASIKFFLFFVEGGGGHQKSIFSQIQNSPNSKKNVMGGGGIVRATLVLSLGLGQAVPTV